MPTKQTSIVRDKKSSQVTRCDAKGCLHSTLYHTNGQIAEEKDIDSLGTLLKHHQLFYNEQNQLVQRHDFVYTQGQFTRKIVTTWKYTKAGQVATLIEAVGTTRKTDAHRLFR